MTDALLIDRPLDQSRAKQLKAATISTHERLDHTIMAAQPFASRESYSRFLLVQHAFHRDIDALYDAPDLAALLPDLAGRRRFALVSQDLADLGVAPLSSAQEPVFAPHAHFSLPTALGWLYVAEGSNLGAAFLLKAAGKLGLNETFGARHLAGAPEGRGLHWRTFTEALDTIALSSDDEAHLVDGAKGAFARVTGLVDQVMR